jgi:xanthine permease XanP
VSDEALKLSGQSFLLGSQHALAAVGGIIAAPLIIAMGMGLSASQTSYLISAALVISGLATVLQIVQIGPLGSGLLSLQGTSFAFVGPLIFLYHGLVETHSSDAALGILFGSALVCAGVMILLTTFV